MKSQVKDESIRIYCSRPWKHKIKQLATIENQSISNYITSMVDRQLTENISPHNQSNNNDVLELLIVSLFQGLYSIKMNNTKLNTIFNRYHKKSLSNKFLLHYIKKGFLLYFLTEILIVILLTFPFLKNVTTITDPNNNPVPFKVTINLLNPLYTSTSKISVGEFIANNYSGADKDKKINYELYQTIVNDLTRYELQNLITKHKNYFISLSILSFGLMIYLNYYLYKKDILKSKKQLHKRGMTLLSKDYITTLLKNKNAVLSIGSIKIPVEYETKHILVFGASGSGKSVLLAQFLNQIIQHTKKYKDKRHFILIDVKPEFVGRFIQKGDFIFCPFDKRGIYWSIFEDIEEIADCDNYATILFDNPSAKDPYWYNAAAAVFSDALAYLYINNKKSNKDIRLFFQQSQKDIASQLDTLPEEIRKSKQHIEGAENTVSSILSTLTSELAPFTFLKDPTKNEAYFSFKKYIRESYLNHDNTIPNLFLVVPTNKQAIMAPLLSLIMDIMISELLTLPEDKSRRIHFILDELGSINKIKMLPDLVTKGRSYGVSIIALTQDPGLMESKYGAEVMNSILNNFGTQIILRLNNAETAKKLADTFGVEEHIEYKRSIQIQSDGKQVPSISEEIETRALVIASDLQSLPDFHGFGKIIGYNPFKLKIPKYFIPEKTNSPNFIPIDKININDAIQILDNQKKVPINLIETEALLNRLKGDK